jgi:hypothetical protein
MRRKPRRLFKARRISGALYVGPHWVGLQPNYMPLLERLAADHAHLVKPGMNVGIHIYHDDNCPALTEGGCCNCNPSLDLVEYADEKEEPRP